MRRAVAWGSALALIVALAACGFMRWPLSAAKVGDSLNAAFGASPRLHWSAPQAASFSALPRPSLRIIDARLDDAYGVDLLSAPAARVNLSLIDLMRGRFIPTGVVLVSPTVTVDVDHPPFAGAAAGSGGPASLARRALAPLASLSLSNGVLRLISAKRGVDTQIDKVQGRFDGLTIGEQLRFNLSAVWRKTPIAVAGALNDPETAAKGAPSPIVFGLNSPLAKLAFGGSLALGDKLSADGDLTASVPSIADLAAFLDTQPPAVLAANDIAITAKVSGGLSALTLGDVKLTSAGQTLEGAVAIRNARGRPAVSGTFAAETLALTPLLGPPERVFDPSGGWSPKPFAFEPLRTFDLDLRLSAAHLDLYGLPLADAAASIIVADGKLSMTSDRRRGLWRPPPGRSARRLPWARPQDARSRRPRRRRPRRCCRRFGLAGDDGERRSAIRRRGLRRLARRGGREPDRNGLARSGGWLHSRRQPRGGAAPQPSPGDRRRARSAPRRNGVRQDRRFSRAGPRARPAAARRDDEPWRHRRSGRAH